MAGINKPIEIGDYFYYTNRLARYTYKVGLPYIKRNEATAERAVNKDDIQQGKYISPNNLRLWNIDGVFINPIPDYFITNMTTLLKIIKYEQRVADMEYPPNNKFFAEALEWFAARS